MGVFTQAAKKAGTYLEQGVEKTKDKSFLEALAGRGPTGPSKDAKMGTALRGAMQRHDAALGVDDFDVEAGLAKLHARLKKEGLFDEGMKKGGKVKAKGCGIAQRGHTRAK